MTTKHMQAKHDHKIKMVTELLDKGVSAEYILAQILYGVQLRDLENIKKHYSASILKSQKAAAECGIEWVSMTLTTNAFSKIPA